MNKNQKILSLALELLDKHYDEREKTCREFKWICHKYLPQSGDEYVKNKNVFDIQDNTIRDLREEKEESRQLLMKLMQHENL